MNSFTNDLKEFNRICLNIGYRQGILEAVSTDGDINDICRRMSSDGLDFMFDIFCRLHNIGESKDESKDEIKEGIEDNVEKYEGMYNYESEDSNENSN